MAWGDVPRRARQPRYDATILAAGPAPIAHCMTHADELKNSGLKATLPRIKVLEVFQNTTQRHMSAEDVLSVLLAEHADIGIDTVNRVLSQFDQTGIMQRTQFGSGKALRRPNQGNHHVQSDRRVSGRAAQLCV